MGPGLGPLDRDLPPEHRPRRPGDGGVHTPPPGDRDPLAHRQIGPLKASVLQLLLEFFVGVGVLGHRHEARGPPVQTVDRVEGGHKPLGSVVGHQEVGQGVPIMPLAGVDGHAAGLVHDHQVLVLIDDGQGAGNGGDLVAARLVPHGHREDLAGRDPYIGKDWDAVQQNSLSQRLGPADRRGGQAQLPAQDGLDSRTLLG